MYMNNSQMQLQSVLASATATGEPFKAFAGPHHPITCNSKLYYEEDGTFRCEHAVAPPDDVRTKQCLVHTLAVLLIELAMEL